MIPRLKFRATVGTTSIAGLYVDLIEIDNEFTGQRFEFGHNLAGIDITTDFSRCYTALTGLVPGAVTDPVTLLPQPLTFAAATWSTGDGDPATKPLSQTWVGNEAARELYGIYNPDTGLMEHRHGIYDSGAAESAETLLAATWLIGTRYHFAPQVNIEANIADLSKVRLVDIATGDVASLDTCKIRVGNVCYVIAENNGLLAAIDARIIRIERYLKEPEKTRIILGDAMIFASDYFTELAGSLEARDARSRPTDRGPGAAVTIASEDTSAEPTYADIVVPAGATDFQDYVAAAIADLPADGGQILILEGEYIYDGEINITKDNVTITGQGEGTVIKLAPGQTGLNYGFVIDEKSGITIRDLVIDGDRDNQSGVTSRGVYATSTNNWAWEGAAGKNWCNANTLNVARNFGWRFQPQDEITADRFRVWFGTPTNVKVNFWVHGTEEMLAEASIYAASSAAPSEKNLPLPLTFTTGNEYVITYQHSTNMRYYFRTDDPSTVYAACKFYTQTTSTADFDAEFNNAVEFSMGVSSTVNSDYTDYPWRPLDPVGVAGFIDFGFGSSYGLSLRNVVVKNHTNSGIHITGGNRCEIINCKSVNNGVTGLWYGPTITTEIGANIKISGNTFSENDQLGMYVSYAEDVLIQNNVLVGNGDAGIIAYYVKNSAIVGNTTRQINSTGIYRLAGIALVSCNDNTVSGNTSSDNVYWGMSLEYSDRNIVTDNVCSNSVNASGIILTATSSYNTVQNNKCYNNPIYGIRIDAGANYNQVTNNDIVGNTTGGLSNAGTGTVTTAGNRST